MIASAIQEIVNEYRDGLANLLGERLDKVILHGSQARGDAGPGADIDVLCVMRSPFDYGQLIEQTVRADGQDKS